MGELDSCASKIDYSTTLYLPADKPSRLDWEYLIIEVKFMKSMLPIFRNKWVKALVLTILLQQFLVAGGTYFLGEITRQFPIEGLRLSTALCLFICIFLPGTIVHYGVAWCTTRAYKSAQLSYLNEYIRSNYNHPTHWRNQSSRLERHDTMCRGGQDSILATVYFLSDFTATGLNIILNTVAIILVTDVMLGIVIALAGLLGLGIIHLAGTKISETSRNEMLADNALNAHLSKSWDNIVLGNQFFFDRWNTCFNDLFLKSEVASLETVNKREWAISLAGMLTNGLVLGTALLLAWTHRETAGFVLAILVMLPRSLQIVMHIQIIQTYLAQWKRLEERLTITHESVLEPKPNDLSHLIQENNITIKMNNTVYSAREIEHLLDHHKAGRFTITGENGTGKSILLLKLKNKFRFSAIYLPAQHELMLPETGRSLSTGEIALASLSDLQASNCNILLLDEWDANLSAENRAVLDQTIHQLSLGRIVVEIRHSVEKMGIENVKQCN